MFNHIEHEIKRNFVRAEHTEDGHFYRTEKGKLYPSVTTIFKALDNGDWKPFWVSSVARKEGITEAEAELRCEEISKNSLEMGNRLHELAEEYVNNPKYVALGSDVEDHIENIDPVDLFEPLRKHLDEHVDNVHGVEIQLYSDEMEIAGTSDLVAEYDGVLSIIDYKNSRKPKTKSECKKKKYFEQITAYANMWEACTGEKIEQGIILVVSWDGKVKPFKVKIDEHQTDLWKYLIMYEQKKALNTT